MVDWLIVCLYAFCNSLLNMVQVERTWTYIIVYVDDRLSSTKVTMLYNFLLCTIVLFMCLTPNTTESFTTSNNAIVGVPLLILLQECQSYLDRKNAVNFVAYKNAGTNQT